MKSIKKPDLKAPRFRGKSLSVLTAKTHKEFIAKYPEYSNLNYEGFKQIVMGFNRNLVEGIIENRSGVELPDGLGYIFIGTCPPSKKKNIDYKKSFEFGVEATHRNWDSDNKLMKIFYTNETSKYPFGNKRVWGFTAVRDFKRMASKAYKEHYLKYVEVAPKQKISALFDRHRKKELARNLKPVIPEGYDEFKM
jgi:hypothetical protein